MCDCGNNRKKHLKVDLHTHILPKFYPNLRERYGYGGFISLVHEENGVTRMMQGDKLFRVVEPNCFEIGVRLEDMEKTEVDVQVISTVPVMFSYWAKPEDCLDLSKMLNDDIANSVKQNPKKFIGLGTIPMQAPDLAIEELRRCMNELNLAGIQIGTNVNEWNLDAPELFPIFEEAERLGAAVFIHPWDMMGQDKMPDYWLPWLVGMPAETARAACCLIFGGVLERLPNLKVCFAHGGGSFPATIGRIEHGFNVRPDLCAIRNNVNPRNYLGKIWVDSLVHDLEALKYLIKLMGEDRVMLGSDYPFPLGEHHPGKLIEETEEFSEELKEKLLSLNCLQFLGIKDKQFYLTNE